MAIIRPCAELRNNYNEISRICHETQEPVYITKNGTNDLVILSNEAYEKVKILKLRIKLRKFLIRNIRTLKHLRMKYMKK